MLIVFCTINGGIFAPIAIFLYIPNYRHYYWQVLYSCAYNQSYKVWHVCEFKRSSEEKNINSSGQESILLDVIQQTKSLLILVPWLVE